MAKDKGTTRPKKSAGDVAHVTAKAVLSAIPVVGGPAAELFHFLIDDPLSKRKDEWIEEIARRLAAVQEAAGQPVFERLRDDPAFVTTLLNATQIAIRNHHQAKLDALANAVVNMALGMTVTETERAMFLGLVDQLTPMHLALLKLFQHPRAVPGVAEHMQRMSMTNLGVMIVKALPELAGRTELMGLVYEDLINRGLMGRGGWGAMMTGSGTLEKRTTSFGDRFVAFVTEP